MGANKHPPNQSQRLESLRPFPTFPFLGQALEHSGLRLCERGESDLERQEVRPGGELAQEEQKNSAAPPPPALLQEGGKAGQNTGLPTLQELRALQASRALAWPASRDHWNASDQGV